MEFGIDSSIPTYSGGLGVLAGDTIRAAADAGLPMVAVTLLHRKGYFFQTLDTSGRQLESPVEWQVDDYLEEMSQRTSILLEARTVHLRCWRFVVTGIGGKTVPIFFLDTDLPENSEFDKHLTDSLYGGDEYYRFCQEVILGIGGLRMLRALGFHKIQRFHMNEGHSSLLTVELMEEEARSAGRTNITKQDLEAVREKCIFTTHTPVPAAHDRYSYELALSVLGNHPACELKDDLCFEGRLNMTYLALNLSHFVNGVAKQHKEISQMMYGRYQIESITNGVHAATWVSPPFEQLYDRHISGWRQDNYSLRYALSIPKAEIWQAHVRAKQRLLKEVNQRTNSGVDVHVFTIGFARRATAYKRPDLLFHDLERLKKIAASAGPFQIIFSGKAHPKDEAGKELIRTIFDAAQNLKNEIRIVYLPNYDMDLAKMITSGVDLWLNTPEFPLEASGTSGMKAAMNGIPSLSVLDGWWIEGRIEGVTGWSIGENSRNGHPVTRAEDAGSLYQKLEETILPMFYKERDQYINVMLHAIALNGSFFNTQRMLQQYIANAYFL
jgi:starch phosphorylase